MLSFVRTAISRSRAPSWTGAVAVVLLMFGVVGRASAQSGAAMAPASVEGAHVPVFWALQRKVTFLGNNELKKSISSVHF